MLAYSLQWISGSNNNNSLLSQPTTATISRMTGTEIDQVSAKIDCQPTNLQHIRPDLRGWVIYQSNCLS